MRTKILFIILIIILLAGLVACSGSAVNDPVSPDLQPQVSETSYEPNHWLWAYVNISWDPGTGEVEVIPVRTIEGHWNVLKFMEQGPCSHCVDVTSATPQPSGIITFGILMTHPFANKNLTGFDVRGIAIFDGSRNYPSIGLNVPDRTLGDGELVNADGYTALYAGATAGAGPGGLEGYQDGKFASPTIPGADINGYKRFISTGAANTRNAFYAGDIIPVDFDIDMPDGGFVFGYAVDASWVPATTKPVTDPMIDFPPEANCPEPWNLYAYSYGTGLTTKGGELELLVQVYDYGLNMTHHAPEVECPEIWNGASTMVLNTTAADHSIWCLQITNTKFPAAGTYKALIRVEDNENATSPAHLDLTAYQVVELEVKEDKGWARTYGGATIDAGQQVAIDMDGNVIVTGSWESALGTPVDFDPGTGEDWETNNGGSDVYVTKYDQYGTYNWTVSFGGPGNDIGLDVDVIGTDIICVGGAFEGTVDFDPDTGAVNRTSKGGTDAFLAKFNVFGGLDWVETWGDLENDGVNTVAISSSVDIYAGGYFRQTVDFDTSSGVSNITSNGGYDCYISKFDSTGLWSKSVPWGGPTDDSVNSIAINTNNELFITGYFSGTVDFDPGTGTVYRSSAGFIDGYLLRLDTTEAFQFAAAWGGLWFDEGRDVAIDPNGDIYVAGYFTDSADFNPLGAGDIHTGAGLTDCFLIKHSFSGPYLWGLDWGGTGFDGAMSVTASPAGWIIAGGFFEGTVDFNTGPGTDSRTASAGTDGFVSMFHGDSTFDWALTLGGGVGTDNVLGVTSTGAQPLYLTGGFTGTVDFDPAAGIDDHTSNGDIDGFVAKYFQDGTY